MTDPVDNRLASADVQDFEGFAAGEGAAPTLQGRSADIQRGTRGGKLRVAMLVGVGLALFGLAAYAFVASRNAQVQLPVTSVPTQDLKNVPGDTRATPAYDAKQAATNADASADAAKAGTSHINTLLGSDNVDREKQLLPVEPAKPTTYPIDAAQGAEATVNDRLKAIRDFYGNEEKSGREGEKRSPHMVMFQEPQPAVVNVSQGASAKLIEPLAKGKDIVLAEGMTFTARVERTVSSDHPGPVHAVIVSEGSLNGARLTGTSRLQMNMVSLPFTTVTHPRTGESLGVSALAFDPNSTSYGIATEVDYHLFQRYGGLLLASLAKATPTLLSPASTITQQLANGALAQATQRASLADVGRGVAADALGQVGADIAASAKRDVTVRVNKDELIGVVLTAPLKLPPTFQGANND